MKAKIKEVHDYFREKICSGEFEISKKSGYTFSILIDGSYVFNIWLANGENSVLHTTTLL